MVLQPIYCPNRKNGLFQLIQTPSSLAKNKQTAQCDERNGRPGRLLKSNFNVLERALKPIYQLQTPDSLQGFSQDKWCHDSVKMNVADGDQAHGTEARQEKALSKGQSASFDG